MITYRVDVYRSRPIGASLLTTSPQQGCLAPKCLHRGWLGVVTGIRLIHIIAAATAERHRGFLVSVNLSDALMKLGGPSPPHVIALNDQWALLYDWYSREGLGGLPTFVGQIWCTRCTGNSRPFTSHCTRCHNISDCTWHQCYLETSVSSLVMTVCCMACWALKSSVVFLSGLLHLRTFCFVLHKFAFCYYCDLSLLVFMCHMWVKQILLVLNRRLLTVLCCFSLWQPVMVFVSENLPDVHFVFVSDG